MLRDSAPLRWRVEFRVYYLISLRERLAWRAERKLTTIVYIKKEARKEFPA